MKKWTLLFLLFFCFCKETIDFLPTNQYNEQVIWDTENSVNLYVNSFYRILTDYIQYGSNPIGSDATMPDGLSDILKYTSSSPGDGTANFIISQDGYTSVNSNHFNIWSNAYSWNTRILEFLEDLKKYGNKFDINLQNRWKGQLLFFRAYIFTLLFRNQGAFIVRNSLNDAVQLPINKETECWDFIEKDLDFCALNLPSEWEDANNDGRITKWIAVAFKTRAMLYAKQWQKVIDAGSTVLNSNKFQLDSNYANIFKNNKSSRSKEIILSKRYDVANNIYNKIDALVTPSFDNVGPDGTKNGNSAKVCPTQELVDAYFMQDGSEYNPQLIPDSNMYKNRESRFYASILYNGANWKGRKIETYLGDGIADGKDRIVLYKSTPDPFATVSGYYVRKLADENLLTYKDPLKRSDQDCIEIRFAEVLLNMAEAYIELNRTNEAKQIILNIRNRSLQTDINNITGDIKQQYQKERMLELAFEGHRFWDLRRWRIAKQILNGKKMHGILITKNANGQLNYNRIEIDNVPRIYLDKFDKFPYPLSEIANNKFINQVEGW